MQNENQSTKTRRFIIEVEVTASDDHFEECSALTQSFVQLLSQFMWQSDASCRAMWCAKEKVILQRGKSHRDVKLPKISEVVK